MIWTIKQVGQAERIYASAFVDEEMIARAAVDVMTAARDKMFRNMTGVAHTFGLELHPGDLEFHERPADVDAGEPPFTTRVDARWRPTTKEVELQGGPRDGEVMAFQYAGDPMSSIKVLAPVNLDDLIAEPDRAPSPTIETRSVSYSLTGWNETARRWVYRLDR